eukprot:scaffold286_cov169-Amphora_coffeaeformis.AAC.6
MNNSRGSKEDEAVAFHFDRVPGEPHNDDVVLGRGTANVWRPGNARFIRDLDRSIKRYNSCRTKKEKGSIIHELFTNVIVKGRFLCQTKEGTFEEVDEIEAKAKISHSLRYRRNRLLSIKESSVSASTEQPRGTNGPTSRSQPATQRTHSSLRSLRPGARVTPMSLPPIFPEIELFADEELSSVLLGSENESDMMIENFFDGFD